MVRKKFLVLMAVLMLAACSLCGCKDDVDEGPIIDDVPVRHVAFDTEDVQVGLKDGSDAEMKETENGFTVRKAMKNEDGVESEASGGGMMLTKEAANNAQANFYYDSSYKEIELDGHSGFAFHGTNANGIEAWVNILDLGDDRYLELYSTLSEEDLAAISSEIDISSLS